MKTTGKLISMTVITAIFIVVASFVISYWRLSQGPISLGKFSDRIAIWVSSGIDDVDIKLTDAFVEKDNKTGFINLVMENINLVDNSNNIIASAPKAIIKINGTKLLFGQVKIKKLELINASIGIKRHLNGKISIGVSDTETLGITQNKSVEENLSKSTSDFFEKIQKIIGANNENNLLETFSITNSTLYFEDEINDAFLIAPDINILFQNVETGLSLYMVSEIMGNGTPWAFSVTSHYLTKENKIKAYIKVRDFIPAQIARNSRYTPVLKEIDVPISGSAELLLASDGSILNTKAEIRTGSGKVGIAGSGIEPISVDRSHFKVNYDPKTKTTAIEQKELIIEQQQASFRGSITPIISNDNIFQAVRYSINTSNIKLTPVESAAIDKAKLNIDNIKLEGLTSFTENKTYFDVLSLQSGNAILKMHGNMYTKAPSPALNFTGELKNVSLPLLLRLWPQGLAKSTRSWIKDKVLSGTISQGQFVTSITSEAMAAAKRKISIPTEQLNLKFKLKDIKTYYFGELPPMESLDATGLLQGDRAEIIFKNGDIPLKASGPISIINGRFFTDELAKDGNIGNITVDLKGPTSSLLEMASYKPIEATSQLGFDPKKIKGFAKAKLQVSLPLIKEIKPEQIKLQINTKLENTVIPNVYPDINLKSKLLEVSVKDGKAETKGNVKLNDINVKLKWTQIFKKNIKDNSEFMAEIFLDRAARKKLGINLGNYITGPIKTKIKAKGNGTTINEAYVQADMSSTNINLNFGPVSWHSPSNNNLKVSFTVMPKDNKIKIINLNANGKNITINGTATFDNQMRLIDINLPNVNLGKINKLNLSGKQSISNTLSLKLYASKYDARSLIKNIINDNSSNNNTRQGSNIDNRTININVYIKDAIAHNSIRLNNTRSDIKISSGELIKASISGSISGSKKDNFSIRIRKNNNSKIVEIESNNAGKMLNAADLYSKMVDGKLDISMLLPASNQIIKGKARIKNFIIRNEKALKGFATVRKGFAGLKSRDVKFKRLNIPFRISKTHIFIQESLIHGPVIGASSRGNIRKSDGKLDLVGSIMPAYQINSALGKVPILGTIIVGGDGQGLFGVTYNVKGKLGAPKVSINAVSALAPGFLRRIFEFGGGETGRREYHRNSRESQK